MPQGNSIVLVHHPDGIEGAVTPKHFHEACALEHDVMPPSHLSDISGPPFFFFGLTLKLTHNLTP